MNRAFLLAIGLGIGTVLFCVLFLNQCSVTHEKQLTIDTLTFDKRVLTGIVSALKDTVRRVEKENANLTRRIDDGRIATAEANEKARVANENRKQAIALLTDREVKYQALMKAYKDGEISKEALKDSITSTPIFSEPEWNRIYVRITGERDMYKAQRDTAVATLAIEQTKSSQLEDILNENRKAILEAGDKWSEEAETKRFLGGLGKNSRKNAARRNAAYYRTKKQSTQ